MQTANANNFTNIYKALVQDEMRNDPQLNNALTQAGKRVDDFQKELIAARANPIADPATIAAAEQRFTEAYANFNQIQQMALRRSMARYSGGVGGVGGGGMPTMQPFQTPTSALFGPQRTAQPMPPASRALQFVNGRLAAPAAPSVVPSPPLPSTQVIATPPGVNASRPPPDLADYYGGGSTAPPMLFSQSPALSDLLPRFYR